MANSRESRGINEDDGGVVHEEDAMLNEFLEKDAASKNRPISGNRPKSAYQSFRQSTNYTSMNKFGESRKILEEGDEVGGTMSIKQR